MIKVSKFVYFKFKRSVLSDSSRLVVGVGGNICFLQNGRTILNLMRGSAFHNGSKRTCKCGHSILKASGIIEIP